MAAGSQAVWRAGIDHETYALWMEPGCANALIMAYLPKEKLLVEVDVYTPASPNGAPPAEPNPARSIYTTTSNG